MSYEKIIKYRLICDSCGVKGDPRQSAPLITEEEEIEFLRKDQNKEKGWIFLGRYDFCDDCRKAHMAVSAAFAQQTNKEPKGD